MSWKDCIGRAVAAGEMDAGRAAEAQGVFDELLEEIGDETLAARETAARMGADAADRRHMTLLQMREQQKLKAGLDLAGDRAEATLASVDATGVHGLPFRSAEQERNAIRGAAHGLMTDAIAHHRRDLAGRTRDKAGELDLLHEAFGESSGNGNAAAFAKAWYDTAELLRGAYNAAGGHIGKLVRWGLPQSWDTVKVRQTDYTEWRNDMLGALDRERMIDAATGRPFSDARLELALRDVYETIRTDGWSKIEPSGQARGRAMANRHADPRFLHFKNADAWLTMHEKYGSGAGAFSTMMAHIDVMAREIGAMRALGPNPSATVRALQQDLQKTAAQLPAGQEGARNRLARTAAHLPVLYDTYTGAVNAPVDGRVSRAFQTARGLLTSAQLGSAFLSALSDQWFSRMAAAHAGLRQARLVKRHWKLFLPGSAEDRKLAVRAGLIAENWSQVASAQMRYVGEVAGPEWARAISDAVLRVSGLSPWTQAGKWAFGMEFMGALADHAGTAFDALPPPLRRTLDNYRIGADSWDLVRATDTYDHRGVKFLRPDDVRARADLGEDLREELATRLLAMIQSETEYAVPSASLRGRALLGGGARPGTVPGELIRSGLMYKSFSVTMYYTHLRRAAQQQGGWNKARYAAELVSGATLMGALTIGLKDISKGRDPRDMTTPGFWGQALLQGGGLGIFGDFLFTDVSRFGHSLGQTLAGPVAGAAGDFLALGQKVAQGKNVGADILRLFGRYAPGASLWYGRLLLERLVLDQIQAKIDPDHARRWRRLELRHERDMGTRHWWGHGAAAPRRAPHLTGAQ